MMQHCEHWTLSKQTRSNYTYRIVHYYVRGLENKRKQDPIQMSCIFQASFMYVVLLLLGGIQDSQQPK